MWLIAPFIQLPIDGIMVVGGIQTHILWVADCWLGTLKIKSIQGGKQQFAVMAIGSCNAQSQR